MVAVQPHIALGQVLGDEMASENERSVLSRFVHTVDTVLVHQDEKNGATMPRDRRHWKVHNLLLPPPGSQPVRSTTVPVTIFAPCSLDKTTPILATYCYDASHPAPQALSAASGAGVDRFTFTHCKVTPETQRARRDLAALQSRGGGRGVLQFCGSWSRGMTLHEDAIVSGLEAANRILGPDRQYRVLQAAVPLPPPFGVAPQPSHTG